MILRAACVWLCLSGWAMAQCQSGPGSSRKTDKLIDDAVEPYKSDKSFGGMVVVVSRAGQTLIKTYGKTRLKNGSAVTADTRFQIGSITKGFTGLLLALLVEQGKVSLDDLVFGLVPAQYNQKKLEDRQTLTLRDLATHTSGLAKNSCITSCPSQTQVSGKPCFSYEDLWRTIAECPLVAASDGSAVKKAIPPNAYSPPHIPEYTSHDDMDDVYPFGARTSETLIRAQYHYSNMAYAALGRLIQKKISDQTNKDVKWEDLVHDKITEPLKMSRTHVFEDIKDLGDTAYSSGGDQRSMFGTYPITNPAGALWSTGSDMLKFLEAMMGHASPVKSAAAKAVEVAWTGPGSKHGIGLAWEHEMLSESTCAEIVWKGGASPGFHSWMGFVPYDDTGVVVLANWTNSEGKEAATQIGHQLLRAMHGGFGL